jgi:transposase-like protein
LTLIRQQIASYCESESPFSGDIELDESYFGRIRGKRGSGAYGKTIVFGIHKRNGCVYTEIVPNCSRKTLYATIQGKVDAASIHPCQWVSHP